MTTKADQWLTEYLDEHGPILAPEVKQAGAAAGYSPRTLQRAMTSIRGRTIGRGPATRWALGVTSTRARTTTEPRQDHATPATTSPDGPPPTGPACPTCGGVWPVRRFEPPTPWWCSYDGTRYGEEAGP